MFGDLGKMMKAASEMKRRMPEVQAKLEAAEFAAESGGGAVRATVNGKGKLTDLRIDGKLLAEEGMDGEVLADLVKSAVSVAQGRAAEAAVEAFRDLTGGMSLPGAEGLM